MGSQKEIDTTPVVLLASGGALVLVVMLWLNQRQQRGRKAGVLNHPGRLTRELMRQASISSAELKQLRMLSESVEAQTGETPDPLTLLLCPSLIAKGLQTAPPKLDRNTLAGIVRKLKLTR